jgi:hypothetical protein
MRRGALLTAIVLAGCGGAARPPATPIAAAGPSPCEQVADHLVGVMRPTDPDPSDARLADTIDVISRVIVERCTQDGWSEAARACFRGLASLDEGDRCAEHLTVEQRDAAGRAMDDAFAARPPPPPAPPPTSSPPDRGPAEAERRPTGSSRPPKPPPVRSTADPCEGGQ